MTARFIAIVILLITAMAARARLDAPVPVTTASALSRFPNVIDSWNGHDIALTPDVIQLAAVDDHLNRQYVSGDRGLGLYVGYYQSQRQGESLHSPLHCLPGTGWQPVVTRRIELQSRGRAVPANELIVQRGPARLLVIYWYQTVSRVTAGEYARKLFLMTDAFSTRRTDVALVRVIAPLALHEHADDAVALTTARPFAQRILPMIQRHLFHD